MPGCGPALRPEYVVGIATTVWRRTSEDIEEIVREIGSSDLFTRIVEGREGERVVSCDDEASRRLWMSVRGFNEVFGDCDKDGNGAIVDENRAVAAK